MRGSGLRTRRIIVYNDTLGDTDKPLTFDIRVSKILFYMDNSKNIPFSKGYYPMMNEVTRHTLSKEALCAHLFLQMERYKQGRETFDCPYYRLANLMNCHHSVASSSINELITRGYLRIAGYETKKIRRVPLYEFTMPVGNEPRKEVPKRGRKKRSQNPDSPGNERQTKGSIFDDITLEDDCGNLVEGVSVEEALAYRKNSNNIY